MNTQLNSMRCLVLKCFFSRQLLRMLQVFALFSKSNYLILKIKMTGICFASWSLTFQRMKSCAILSSFASLKPDCHLPKKKFFFCFKGSPLKVMENVFYFILKGFFVLKIFNFLSWLYGHVEKRAWWER